MVTTINAHTDLICSINFCRLNESILVIIGSYDRKVSLHNIFGTQIGIFGQPDLWKIKPATQLNELHQETKEFKTELFIPEPIIKPVKKEILRNEKKLIIERSRNISDSKKQMTVDDGEYQDSSLGMVKKLNACLNLEDTFNYEKEAFIKNPLLRYNPWAKTILGKFIYLNILNEEISYFILIQFRLIISKFTFNYTLYITLLLFLET